MNSSSSGSAPKQVVEPTSCLQNSFSLLISSKKEAISGGAPTCPDFSRFDRYEKIPKKNSELL